MKKHKVLSGTNLFLVLALFLATSLFLTACGASANKTSALEDKSSSDGGNVAFETTAETEAGALANEPTDSAGAVVIDPGDASDSGKKIIYTVNISLEADDAAKAVAKITSDATAIGGYISDSSYTAGEDSSSATVTVRIPPEKLKSFSDGLSDLGTIQSSNMYSQDVTANYVDLTSRLTNAEAQEKQLLAIMAQAVKIEDILAVRQELDSVQQDIETIKGQLRLMDNQVGYSTVTIQITEPTPPPAEVKPDPNSGLLSSWTMSYIGTSMQKAFTNSIAVTSYVFGGILTIVSFLFIPALIIGAILAAIIIPIKVRKKRKNNKAK